MNPAGNISQATVVTKLIQTFRWTPGSTVLSCWGLKLKESNGNDNGTNGNEVEVSIVFQLEYLQAKI